MINKQYLDYMILNSIELSLILNMQICDMWSKQRKHSFSLNFWQNTIIKYQNTIMGACLFWGVFIMHFQCSYQPLCIALAINGSYQIKAWQHWKNIIFPFILSSLSGTLSSKKWLMLHTGNKQGMPNYNYGKFHMNLTQQQSCDIMPLTSWLAAKWFKLYAWLLDNI